LATGWGLGWASLGTVRISNRAAWIDTKTKIWPAVKQGAVGLVRTHFTSGTVCVAGALGIVLARAALRAGLEYATCVRPQQTRRQKAAWRTVGISTKAVSDPRFSNALGESREHPLNGVGPFWYAHTADLLLCIGAKQGVA